MHCGTIYFGPAGPLPVAHFGPAEPKLDADRNIRDSPSGLMGIIGFF